MTPRQVVMLSPFLLLTGCVKPTAYIVLRDVPTNPSFTVIPANDFANEVYFASKIEEYILRSGVKVVARPASKFVETKKELAKAEAEIQRGAVAQASQTERYYSLEDTKADYIVETFADPRQIKVIKKSTLEILSTFSLTDEQTKERGGGSSDDEVIFNMLKNLGIPVRAKASN